VTIRPETVQITLASGPIGLQLVYGGTPVTAPFTRTAIVGATRTIFAPSPQGQYTFERWSDAGAQQHNILVPSTDATFTAFFVDRTAPTVTGVTPANGATGVARRTTVTASFSEAVDPTTLTTQSVTLVRAGTTVAIAATVTYDAATRTVTLRPSAALDPNAMYTATVSTAVKDVAGNALAAPRSWSFTTGRGQ
jgi:hypothetical protein